MEPSASGRQRVIMVFLKVMIVLVLLATLVALGLGVVSMGRGGDYDLEHSGQFMSGRVSTQGIAVLFMLVALYLGSG